MKKNVAVMINHKDNAINSKRFVKYFIMVLPPFFSKTMPISKEEDALGNELTKKVSLVK